MQWYYAIDGEQQGPIEESDLQQLAATGTITDETLVWNESLPDWKPYAEAFAPAAAIDADATMGQQLATHVTEADVVLPPGHEACCTCNQPFAVEEMIAYEGQHVCAGCKDSFFQRIREGAPLPLGGGGTGQTPNKELMARAKDILKGNWWPSFGAICLVYLAFGATYFLAIVLAGPLLVGLIRYFLLKTRNQPHSINDAFSGFSHFGNAWLVTFLTVVYVYIWMFPLMIAVGLAAAAAVTASPIIAMIVIPVAYVLAIILMVRAMYTYMPSIAVAAEYRDIPATDCMRRSKRMMTGHRWKLFCLIFRIYWPIMLISMAAMAPMMILPGRTAGIVIYVIFILAAMFESCRRGPLLITAFTVFYDDVRGLAEEQ